MRVAGTLEYELLGPTLTVEPKRGRERHTQCGAERHRGARNHPAVVRPHIDAWAGQPSIRRYRAPITSCNCAVSTNCWKLVSLPSRILNTWQT